MESNEFQVQVLFIPAPTPRVEVLFSASPFRGRTVQRLGTYGVADSSTRAWPCLTRYPNAGCHITIFPTIAPSIIAYERVHFFDFAVSGGGSLWVRAPSLLLDPPAPLGNSRRPDSQR